MGYEIPLLIYYNNRVGHRMHLQTIFLVYYYQFYIILSHRVPFTARERVSEEILIGTVRAEHEKAQHRGGLDEEQDLIYRRQDRGLHQHPDLFGPHSVFTRKTRQDKHALTCLKMTKVPRDEVGYKKRSQGQPRTHTDNGILQKSCIATKIQLIIDRLFVLHWTAVELVVPPIVHERRHQDRIILSEKKAPNAQLIIRFELRNRRTEEVSTFLDRI